MSRGQNQSANLLFGPRKASKLRQPRGGVLIEPKSIDSTFMNLEEYSIPYEVQSTYYCDESDGESSCEQEGICRCHTIDGVDVDIRGRETIARAFLECYSARHQGTRNLRYKPNSIEEFGNLDLAALSWIVRAEYINKTDFTAEAEADYYGDILKRISISHKLASAIDTAAKEYAALESKEQEFDWLYKNQFGDAPPTGKVSKTELKVANIQNDDKAYQTEEASLDTIEPVLLVVRNKQDVVHAGRNLLEAYQNANKQTIKVWLIDQT